MGEKTGIAWCDHTFNPWIGCQKVSAGCVNCYAARDNDRYKWVGEWGKDYRRTRSENWKKPIQWAKQAVKDGAIRRVFCASLADVFDTNIPDLWRLDLWKLIWETQLIGGLEWLILTKRPENIPTRIPTFFDDRNSCIRIGVTAENQEMADKRIPVLLEIWNGKNFISVEPMLENIILAGYSDGKTYRPWLDSHAYKVLVDWVICGSESGPRARSFVTEWARSLRDQCKSANVPFFLKQMTVDGKLVHMPELDGVVWDQFPKQVK
jgi:protein gp37